MKARAKGVIKEGDTIIDGTKIISKEAKQAYSDFLAFLLLPQYVHMLYYEQQYVLVY
jgi:hypothetical protein